MSVNVWKWLTMASLGVLIALLINDSDRKSASVLISGSPAEASAGQSTNAGLMKDIQELRAEVAQLRSDIHTPPDASVEAERETLLSAESEMQTLASATQPSVPDPGDPAQFIEQDDLRERQHFEAIDARVAGETVDDDWSLFASNTISNALSAQDSVELQIGQIDCRSTLCRVEVNMDPHLDLEDLLMALPPETRTTFPRLAAHVSPIDPATRIIYLNSSADRFYGE